MVFHLDAERKRNEQNKDIIVKVNVYGFIRRGSSSPNNWSRVYNKTIWKLSLRRMINLFINSLPLTIQRSKQCKLSMPRYYNPRGLSIMLLSIKNFRDRWRNLKMINYRSWGWNPKPWTINLRPWWMNNLRIVNVRSHEFIKSVNRRCLSWTNIMRCAIRSTN